MRISREETTIEGCVRPQIRTPHSSIRNVYFFRSRLSTVILACGAYISSQLCSDQ